MTDASAEHMPPPPEPPPPARPARRSAAAIALFLGVTLALLVADLVLKQWAFNHVADRPVVLTDLVTQDHRGFWMQYPHEPTVVWPGVLHLQLTTNTGAVFGLGKGNRAMFIVVSVLATAIITFIFLRSPASARGLHLALALILAGALGNLYDRVVYRAVRDMLHMFPHVELPWGLHWPGGVPQVWPWIFNLADVALLVGVALVLIVTWRSEQQTR